MKKIVPKIKFKEEINKTNHFPKIKIISKKLTNNSTNESNNELNQSWDFTPFPK